MKKLGADEFAEERRRAEVFDALSHPTRIMILKALNENPVGFADLKKQLGIESSGHLQHHISKLNSLVKTDEYGKYTLSDEGKDALNSVETVEKVTESGAKHKQKVVRAKTSNVLKIVSLFLATLLVASCLFAVFEYNTVSVLRNELDTNNDVISELGSQIDTLNATVSQQNEKMSQLATELNLAKSVMAIEQPIVSHYLRTGGQFQDDLTKIFLQSTDVWLNDNSVVLPFYNVLIARPDNGTQLYNTTISITVYSIFSGYSYMVCNGDKSILMIGATVRNDYNLEDAENLTSQNLPMYNSSSFIKLSAKLYDRNGNIIETKEANFTGTISVIGNQEFALKNGETKQVVFYLEPSSWNIDHYEIFVDYVTDSPQSN